MTVVFVAAGLSRRPVLQPTPIAKRGISLAFIAPSTAATIPRPGRESAMVENAAVDSGIERPCPAPSFDRRRRVPRRHWPSYVRYVSCQESVAHVVCFHRGKPVPIQVGTAGCGWFPTWNARQFIWQARASLANEFWDIELDPLLRGMRR
jgi:hypothetical protein